jgi:hypothetical protein
MGVYEVFMAVIPVCVSMFVYFEVASVVNNSAQGGSCSFLSSLIIVVESFTYDLTNGSSCFSLKSSQIEKIASRLLVLLTTGLRVNGVLCTLSL